MAGTSLISGVRVVLVRGYRETAVGSSLFSGLYTINGSRSQSLFLAAVLQTLLIESKKREGNTHKTKCGSRNTSGYCIFYSLRRG
ncbi:hypothetical protein KPB2_5552 [Klebsiella pneumoniae Kb677]|nr:hypothetical protein KPB2_5552 [Klebsiella pneumoniae Kb677]